MMRNGTTLTRSRHFNPLAKVLHWLMAVAILAMLFIGVAMMASMTWRPWLLDLHRPLGIAILLLAVVRLINRLRHPAPPLPDSVPGWQAAAARASHWLLYILMLGLWLLFAVVIAHLSAALMHAWVYRDGVFASMAGRRR